MAATQLPARRKPANKSGKAPARPVTNTLLELAYLMHATKVVGVRETPAPRKASGRTV